MTTSVARYTVWRDLIRGLAAMVVFLGHARVVLIGSIAASVGIASNAAQENAAAGAGTATRPELTSYGHMAVIIFFVLSGYLVGGGRSGRYANSAGRHPAMSCSASRACGPC